MSIILIKILQFVLSLSFLVLVHEFGHFIAARIFKIRVEKFYIFFNPWFTLYKRKFGETEYGVGWLPLGGYVSLSGMIDESMNTEQMNQPPQPWEFRTKPAWQRLIVMLAGIMMNVITAMVIYSAILLTWGDNYYRNSDMKNGYVYNEAGLELGFEHGDRIVSINGEHIERTNDIISNLFIVGDDVSVDVARGNDTVTLALPNSTIRSIRERKGYENFVREFIPFEVVGIMEGSNNRDSYQIGDRIYAINGEQIIDYVDGSKILETLKGKSADIDVVRGTDTLRIATHIDQNGSIGIYTNAPTGQHHVSYNFFESIPAGISRTGEQLASYWNQVKLIFNPESGLYKEVGGFIAIGSIFPDEWNWQSFWALTAFLSIALAIMNLLPIPGLDGGHALFTLWEIITRRKPSDKFLTVMQWIGLIFLLMLMVFANGNDIIKLFG